VGVEHRVREERAGAPQRGRERVRGVGVETLHIGHRDAERLPHARKPFACGGLVAGDADVVFVDPAQGDAEVAGQGDNGVRPAGDRRGDGVEELAVHDVDAALGESGGEHGGHPVGAQRDPAQPVGPVVDGVHRRHHGQQDLRGADVRGGFLAADVLFPRLQGEPVRGRAAGVLRNTDEPAGQLPLQAVAHRQVRGVRAAEAERDAEALRRPDGDVGAELARRPQQGQGEGVGGDDHGRAVFLGVGDGEVEFPDRARGARVGQQDAEEVPAEPEPGESLGKVLDDELDAERLGPRAQDGEGLRQGVSVDDEPGGRRPPGPAHERHGFGGGGGLVEQGGVRDGQPGEVGDHGLEVEEGFEPPLGDFRLVGRVGGVPGRVFEDVAPDDGRGDGVVVAEPDHGGGRPVPGGELAKFGEGLRFGSGRRQFERLGGLPQRRRHGPFGEFVEGGDADDVEDVAEFVRPGPDVPVGEGNALFQRGE
jgi:hypothetical protein